MSGASAIRTSCGPPCTDSEPRQNATPTAPSIFTLESYVQAGPHGRPLFVHRHYNKFAPPGQFQIPPRWHAGDLPMEATAWRFFLEWLTEPAGEASFPDEVPGWFTRAECELWHRACRDRDVLELGRHHGRSTVVAASAARRVVSLDRESEASADLWSQRYGVRHKVWLRRGLFATLVATCGGPFSASLIDGSHDRASVEADIDTIVGHLSPALSSAFTITATRLTLTCSRPSIPRPRGTAGDSSAGPIFWLFSSLRTRGYSPVLSANPFWVLSCFRDCRPLERLNRVAEYPSDLLPRRESSRYRVLTLRNGRRFTVRNLLGARLLGSQTLSPRGLTRHWVREVRSTVLDVDADLTVELISEVGTRADATFCDSTAAREPADSTAPRLASSFRPLASPGPGRATDEHVGMVRSRDLPGHAGGRRRHPGLCRRQVIAHFESHLWSAARGSPLSRKRLFRVVR